MSEIKYSHVAAFSGDELADELNAFVSDMMHDHHEWVEIKDIHYSVAVASGGVMRHNAIIKYEVTVRNGVLV